MTQSFNNTQEPVVPATDCLRVIGGDGGDRLLGLAQAVSGIVGAKEINVATNGSTYTIGDQTNVYIFNNGGTIAGATLNMPAHPLDGQRVKIVATHTITTLTHQANAGQTLNSALTTIGAAASTFGEWIYNLADTTWYRCG